MAPTLRRRASGGRVAKASVTDSETVSRAVGDDESWKKKKMMMMERTLSIGLPPPPWETKKELNLDQQPTKSKIGRARLAPLPFFVAGKDEEYEGDASGEQKCRKKKNRKPSQPPVALK